MVRTDPTEGLPYDEFDGRLISDWLETYRLVGIHGGDVPSVPTSAREGEYEYAQDNARAWPFVDLHGFTVTEAHALMVRYTPPGATRSRLPASHRREPMVDTDSQYVYEPPLRSPPDVRAVPLSDAERGRRAAEFIAKTHRGIPTTTGRYNQSHGWHGHFTGGGGGGGGGTASISDTKAAELASSAAVPSGGFTVDVKTGKAVTDGYAVAIYPELSKTAPATSDLQSSIKDYVRVNQQTLSQPGNNFGGWHDPESGQVWLDVSHVVADKASAIKLGQQHNQIAIFDIRNGVEISTGGTGKVAA